MRMRNKVLEVGNSLVVRWLGLGTLTAEAASSILSWGTKIPLAMWRGQKKIFLKIKKRS